MGGREVGLKSLEVARQEKFIGAPLEARVHLSANGDLYPLLEEYASDLPGLFIVSQVGLEKKPAEEMGGNILRAQGTKREPSGSNTTDLASTQPYHTLCNAC